MLRVRGKRQEGVTGGGGIKEKGKWGPKGEEDGNEC